MSEIALKTLNGHPLADEEARATLNALNKTLSQTPALACTEAATLPDGTDFNTLTTPGSYRVMTSASAQSMLHCPSTSSGRLFVITATTTVQVIQIYVSNASPVSFYIRPNLSSDWRPWARLADRNYVDSMVAALETHFAEVPTLITENADVIADGTDFDTLVDPGNYRVTKAASAATMNHIPTATSGRLFVLQTTDSSRLVQLYLCNGSGGWIFLRYYSEETWSDWNHLASRSFVTDEIAAATENVLQTSSFDGGTLLGNQTVNTSCRLSVVSVTDAPADINLESYPGWLMTLGGLHRLQLLFYFHEPRLYIRYNKPADGTWIDWQLISGEAPRQSLKLLIVGNSFNQDAVAYLPPLLEELLPDTDVTIADCYTDSADISKHILMFSNDTPFDRYNLWQPGDTSWSRYAAAGVHPRTLREALAEEDWDLILTNATTSDVVPDNVDSMVIEPLRQFLRLLQTNARKPFQMMWFQVMGRAYSSYTASEMYAHHVAATQRVMQETGVMDYIPIGTTIENARTNSTLAALGAGGNLLHSDNKHLGAGLPALLAAYTTALKIVEWAGRRTCGLYGSSFVPDEETAIAINASNGTGGGMTHGVASGVTPSNIQLAQEIAVLAVKHPDQVIDCANMN